ncbi:hypothetical protein COCNU_15G005440 [Cocos nucifera]|uniref:Uncharacterized protein n=1 Tax=Cocos nucifera TaxID=13894 RepID=A0A8K0NEC8_COCNU|nr:hypothetical protein COCNU_15G005440 [Cocos nucifera]
MKRKGEALTKDGDDYEARLDGKELWWEGADQSWKRKEKRIKESMAFEGKQRVSGLAVLGYGSSVATRGEEEGRNWMSNALAKPMEAISGSFGTQLGTRVTYSPTVLRIARFGDMFQLMYQYF